MFLAAALAVLAAATPTPQIQAHRGGSFVNGRAIHPEATLPAFRAAAKAGFVLELDIQMAKDGVPIVMHDDTLDRTTVCRGPVAARTAADIVKHCPTDRLGSPGSALGSRRTRRRIPVPTLAQVLALVHRTGATASIELKQFDPAGASARALAAALRRAGVPLSKVIVQSFFPPNLARAHAAMPGVATSTLTLQQAQATSIQAAVDAGSAWVSPQFPVDAAYVEAAHAAGRQGRALHARPGRRGARRRGRRGRRAHHRRPVHGPAGAGAVAVGPLRGSPSGPRRARRRAPPARRPRSRGPGSPGRSSRTASPPSGPGRPGRSPASTSPRSVTSSRATSPASTAPVSSPPWRGLRPLVAEQRAGARRRRRSPRPCPGRRRRACSGACPGRRSSTSTTTSCARRDAVDDVGGERVGARAGAPAELLGERLGGLVARVEADAGAVAGGRQAARGPGAVQPAADDADASPRPRGRAPARRRRRPRRCAAR